MKKEKLIRQTGYMIKGTVLLKAWDGGTGEIDMDSSFILYENFNKTTLLECINDGRFGCEAILQANIEIYIKYDNASEEYVTTIFTDRKEHLQVGKRGI